MTTDRPRRLRKELCVDEFQELGFGLDLHYKEGVGVDAMNAFVLRFIDQAIEANELTYGGCDEFDFVCLTHCGSVNREQRVLIEAWLKQQLELANVEVGALVDVRYPERPVLPKP